MGTSEGLSGWEDVMQASAGDALTVRGAHQGEPDRHGQITEVHGENGGPPYLVRWDDGHESVYFPGPDTVIAHHPAGQSASLGAS